MTKLIISIAAAAAVVLGAGSVSAQTFGSAAGTKAVTGTLNLKHLLPSTSTCTLNSIPVTVASTTSVMTNFGGTFGLCTQPLLAGVTAVGDWNVTPNGVDKVQITTQRINTILGWCPSKVLNANVTGRGTTWIDLQIPLQTWAGQLSGTCEASGTVRVSNVTYS
ncbi:MAG: hypothetical protein P0Y52_03540 [Candidatus Brevundimonas phytovorans]|nr:hypothetical protein [Brevundimonas sp.]WEK58622.1 MAG: hypothetical protein P0Y52_03540 [Brevundimonas sp.]